MMKNLIWKASVDDEDLDNGETYLIAEDALNRISVALGESAPLDDYSQILYKRNANCFLCIHFVYRRT